MDRLRYYAQRAEAKIRRLSRRLRRALPLGLDLAGYAMAVAGVWELAGSGWGKIALSAALILAGIRAQDTADS